MGSDHENTLMDRLKALLIPAGRRINPVYFWGRVLFFVFIFLWSWKFILAPVRGDAIGRSFMHLVNTPFHEAGHVLFSFFGDFMGVLGGTLMQLLVPTLCMAAFLKKGDAFSASFSLWWIGQSFIDAAPYIYDARAGELMLLGGVTGQDAPDMHDWNVILGRLGILPYDHTIAYTVKYLGSFIILLALAWGACLLILQLKSLDR